MQNTENLPSKPTEEQKQLLSGLLQNLSPKDAEKVQQILNDKSATDKILSTPQAQIILQKLLGGK